MSRSYRKICILGNSYSPSEKKDKRLYNRRFRRVCKHYISDKEDLILPALQLLYDTWEMDKDGKFYFYLAKNEEEILYSRHAVSLEFYKKHMRK